MPTAPRLPGDEAAVLDAIGDSVRHVDGVAGATRLPTNRILAALLSLELRGLVESLPGKQYRRA